MHTFITNTVTNKTAVHDVSTVTRAQPSWSHDRSTDHENDEIDGFLQNFAIILFLITFHKYFCY